MARITTVRARDLRPGDMVVVINGMTNMVCAVRPVRRWGGGPVEITVRKYFGPGNYAMTTTTVQLARDSRVRVLR
jgi:hypothetical protein